MSQEGSVKSGPIQEVARRDPDPLKGGSALVAASLHDALNLIAYSALEQRRKVLVHPLTDKRLHGRQKIGLVPVHPVVKKRIDRARNGPFENRLDRVSR